MIICSAISDAGINTVICLVVVFAVLIFISFLISLFKYIPKLGLLYLRRIRKQSLQRVRLSTPYHRLRLRKRKKNSPMTLSL